MSYSDAAISFLMFFDERENTMKIDSRQRHHPVHPFVGLVSTEHSREAKNQEIRSAAISQGMAAQYTSEMKAKGVHKPSIPKPGSGIESIEFHRVKGEIKQFILDIPCLRAQAEDASSPEHAKTFYTNVCKDLAFKLRHILVSSGNYQRLFAQVTRQGTSNTHARAGEFLEMELFRSERILGTIVVPKPLLCPERGCGKAVVRQFIKH